MYLKPTGSHRSDKAIHSSFAWSANDDIAMMARHQDDTAVFWHDLQIVGDAPRKDQESDHQQDDVIALIGWHAQRAAEVSRNW